MLVDAVVAAVRARERRAVTEAVVAVATRRQSWYVFDWRYHWYRLTKRLPLPSYFRNKPRESKRKRRPARATPDIGAPKPRPLLISNARVWMRLSKTRLNAEL